MLESRRYNDHSCILMDTPVGPLTDSHDPMQLEDVFYAKRQLMA